MHGRAHRKGIQCRRLGRENEQYEQAIKKGSNPWSVSTVSWRHTPTLRGLSRGGCGEIVQHPEAVVVELVIGVASKRACKRLNPFCANDLRMAPIWR